MLTPRARLSVIVKESEKRLHINFYALFSTFIFILVENLTKKKKKKIGSILQQLFKKIRNKIRLFYSKSTSTKQYPP